MSSPTAGSETSQTQDSAAAAPASAQDSPKVIKRYSNRKLYDTGRSKYVTLDEIARMVRAGEDVCIIDNETKEDLTSVTLTQIIYEREKSSRTMPLGVLRDIIQTSGETLNELFDRSVATATKSVESSVTEIRQGALSFRDLATRQLAEITESARRFFSKEERRAEEFRRTAWVHLDQLQSRLEQRVREVQGTRSAIEQHQKAPNVDPEGLSLDERLERNTHSLAHVEALRARLLTLDELVAELERAARGEDGHREDNR